MTTEDSPIEFIHHYTSVEALALILSSRKIRFNRVDNVDDMSEASRHSAIQFGHYFFVSCWTYDKEESVPQWHMYTERMQGVRISLPAYPFAQIRLEPNANWPMESQGELFAPIPFTEMFGDSYFIVPMYMRPEHFGGPVEYCEDVNERYEKAVTIKQDGERSTVQIERPFDLVRLKTHEWEFQKEYRFGLLILPSLPVPEGGPGSPEFAPRMANHIANSIRTGQAPGINYFDVDLSEDALKEMTITTGPLCSEGSKLIVHSLVKTYSPEARIQSSAFECRIRL